MLAADPGYVEPDDVLIGDSFQRAGLKLGLGDRLHGAGGEAEYAHERHRR